MTLRISSIESLLRGISADVLAGEKLSVMVGDTVRVRLDVDYRGPDLDAAIHVSYGFQNTWFNEDGAKQKDIPAYFDASMNWVTYHFYCDVPIGGAYGAGYDLYAKIMGVPGPDIFSPTLLNVLDVMGAAEFRSFGIAGYEKI